MSSQDMGGCEFVSNSPDRPNIFYEVRPYTDIENDMHSVLSSLKEHKTQAPRVLVYCRSLTVCADLYAYMYVHYELGDASYYPPGAPHVSDNRNVWNVPSNTPLHNKDVILRSLIPPLGVVRVVFATVNCLGYGHKL